MLQPADADKKTTTPPAPLTNDIPSPQRTGPAPESLTHTPMTAPTTPAKRPVGLSDDEATAQLNALATTLAARGLSFAQAVKAAGIEHPELVACRATWTEDAVALTATPDPDAPVLSLSERAAMTWQLVDTIETERKLSSTRRR